MGKTTLQDIVFNNDTVDNKTMLDMALSEGVFNEVMQRAQHHPDSRLDLEDLENLRIKIEERARSNHDPNMFCPPSIDAETAASALALIDQWIMSRTVEEPNTPRPQASRGMRF